MNLEVVEFGTDSLIYSSESFSFTPCFGMKIVAQGVEYIVMKNSYDLDNDLLTVTVVRDEP